MYRYYADEWVNGTTMGKFSRETANIYLINRQISRGKKLGYIKTTLSEMNLWNQQNFFSSRYAARITRKKREPCNKATSQELLSRGEDKEIPLGIRRTARRFLYGNFIMLPWRVPSREKRARGEEDEAGEMTERREKQEDRERDERLKSFFLSFLFMSRRYLKFCTFNCVSHKCVHGSLRSNGPMDIPSSLLHCTYLAYRNGCIVHSGKLPMH